MKYRILLILLSIFSLAGCTNSPSLPRLAPDATILAFGDSLTYGTGASASESYPAVLAALIHRKVLNAGEPGATTSEGRERLADELDATQPALLILCMGGNDFLRKHAESETIANLRVMLDEARTRQLPVLLVATPRPGLGLSVPTFYADLAKEYKVALEAESLEDILSARSLKSDLIHPNAAGYRQLAEAIAQALKKAGAI